MQKTQTRYNDVKPSELKKGDRIHTAAGLFQVVAIEPIDEVLKKNYIGLILKPVFPKSKKKAFLAVHKSARFSVTRPNK